jgi:hypothetical protein
MIYVFIISLVCVHEDDEGLETLNVIVMQVQGVIHHSLKCIANIWTFSDLRRFILSSFVLLIFKRHDLWHFAWLLTNVFSMSPSLSTGWSLYPLGLRLIGGIVIDCSQSSYIHQVLGSVISQWYFVGKENIYATQ